MLLIWEVVFRSFCVCPTHRTNARFLNNAHVGLWYVYLRTRLQCHETPYIDHSWGQDAITSTVRSATPRPSNHWKTPTGTLPTYTPHIQHVVIKTLRMSFSFTHKADKGRPKLHDINQPPNGPSRACNRGVVCLWLSDTRNVTESLSFLLSPNWLAHVAISAKQLMILVNVQLSFGCLTSEGQSFWEILLRNSDPPKWGSHFSLVGLIPYSGSGATWTENRPLCPTMTWSFIVLAYLVTFSRFPLCVFSHKDSKHKKIDGNVQNYFLWSSQSAALSQ